MVKASFVWFGQGGDPPPPGYSTVDGADAERVRALLARRLGIASEIGKDVERALFARSEFVTSIAEGVSIDFAAVLKDRSLSVPKQVLLSWDPMQTFYCVEFHKFLASLPFLFELEVFDLLVLDEESGWGVYLMHYGELRVVTISKPPSPRGLD